MRKLLPPLAFVTMLAALALVLTAFTTGYFGPYSNWYSECNQSGANSCESTSFGSGWVMPNTPLGLNVEQVTCSWDTVGVGGTTGVVVKIRNVTDSTDLCSCTIGACTIAAFTPTACNCGTLGTTSTALVPNKLYAVQLTSGTDCATNPLNIHCGVNVTH